MRGLYIRYLASALLLMLATAACDSNTPSATPTPVPEISSPVREVPASVSATPTSVAAAPTTIAGSATAESEDPEQKLESLDPTQFDHSTQIDNPWLPETPGKRMVYEGFTVDDEGKSIPHRVVLNVTDLTKVIGGVRTIVSWDLDYSDGQLEEVELIFFAQDKTGNVWHLGQYPEVYENGQIIETPSWLHGIQDGRAGIMMQANPQLERPSYSEGWSLAVDWTDRGKVDQMGQKTCVPLDCYEDVLVIAETARSEPGAEQLKYYARGVGNVRVGWRGAGEKTKETLELVEVTQLSAAELEEVRAKALEQEQRAYAYSKDVYAQTAPMELPPGVARAPTAPPAQASATPPAATGGEVVVYAADLPESALAEFQFQDDPASPGGKLLGTENTGGQLDPPPEDDPHVTFKVAVQSGVAYRCWMHMKVGAPQGQSQANMFWVQLSDAVDKANKEVFRPGTGSYLTARGPQQPGWAWVGCDAGAAGTPESRFYIPVGGDVTVPVQAGIEGTGFDQFLLSPARFLTQPPSEPVVTR